MGELGYRSSEPYVRGWGNTYGRVQLGETEAGEQKFRHFDYRGSSYRALKFTAR